MLRLYSARNVLLSALAKQPDAMKRLRWRLALGLELAASPSLLVLHGVCDGAQIKPVLLDADFNRA